MTTLELPDLEAQPEPRRDRFGRYLIIPAAGGKPRPYTRATTWAKALDDQGGLINWSMRMCALGLVQRKDLYAQVAAARKDDRDALSKLVEQAKEAGGGSEGANIGSALHAFTERIDLGEDVVVPDLWRPDVDAYRAVIDEHGLEVRRDLVERVVVVEALGVAGTLDRVYVAGGRLVIGDVKTGQSLDFSRLAIAVQLALYANADTLYNLATETHEPMVDVDKSTALVVHVPSGRGKAYVHEVDIAEGWRYAQLAGVIRAARAHGKRSTGDCLFRLRRVADGEPTVLAPALKIVPEQPSPTESGPLRTWVLGRLNVLDEHPAAKRAMKDRWPTDVPKLSSGHQHADAELRHLADALDTVERDFSIPFGASDPTIDRTPRVVEEPPPLPPLVDEGAQVGAEDVDAIVAVLQRLPPEQRSVLESWPREAHLAGVGFSIRMNPSQRRYAIYQALIALAPLVDDDLERVRATIAAVIPDAAMPTISLGGAIGALTIAEAEQLRDIALAVRNDEPGLQYGIDGAVRWATPTTQTEEETDNS